MLNIVMLTIMALVAPYGLYYLVVAIRGLFRRDEKNPPAKSMHRFAALIPARNEEAVIGFLVDSLQKQRYPRELFDIYVVVNNSTDATRARAIEAGAVVIDCDRPISSKGEALKYTFEKLLAVDAPRYDAFLIFDADNLVDKGFIGVANDALDAGWQIAQGYRDSKNPKDNWVAGCTSVFYWFMSSLYNNSRRNIGMSAALNGTGIMLSADLIREQGFDTDTLTEDLEYTALSVLNGHKVGWMKDAVIYDEQPITLEDSYTQRRRWGAGSLQCARKFLRPLIAKAIRDKDGDAFDIALLYTGMVVQAISLVPPVLTSAGILMAIIQSPTAGFRELALVCASALMGSVLAGIAYALLIVIIEKKWHKLSLSSYLLMWLYMLVWVPANLSSLVMGPPKWTSIAHVSAKGIDDCEETGGEKGTAVPVAPPKSTGM